MIQLNVFHASISQSKSNLKIPWNRIRNIIRLAFLNTDFRITICKGQVCVPELKDRLRIIRECHTVSEDTRELRRQWRGYDINIFGRT